MYFLPCWSFPYPIWTADVVVMNMIDMTASDVRWCWIIAECRAELSTTFSRKLQILALTAFPATVNFLPFLFLLVILQLSSRTYTLSNRSVASGNVCSAANDSRRCKSVISADQWEGDSYVLFGMGREWLLIYVRYHSDMVGTCHVGIDWFAATDLYNITVSDITG